MDRIQVVISEIGEKISKMRSSLVELKADNSKKEEELNLLREKLRQREVEVEDFKNKYESLSQQFEQRSVVDNDGKQDKNAQIDALVREIDDCINHLKA